MTSQRQSHPVTEVAGIRIPTLHDVFAARKVVDAYLPRTPLITSAALNERLGFTLHLKCENLQPIRAFKVRGGINLLASLDAATRARGVCTASTGNHGQSIAYAAQVFGTRAVIYVPVGANPIKVEAMERLEATVVQIGKDFDESRMLALEHADRDGMYYVHPANEPLLISGVATYSLEILEAVPDLDVLIVPMGGGSGLSGACIAGKGINLSLQVVGVQAIGAPAAHDAWRSGKHVSYPSMQTFAEGVATRATFELPMAILWQHLDDFRLVTDQLMKRSILTLLETTSMLAEGAGVAAIAAAYDMRQELAGKQVAAVLCGGNLTLDVLRQAINEETPW